MNILGKRSIGTIYLKKKSQIIPSRSICAISVLFADGSATKMLKKPCSKRRFFFVLHWNFEYSIQISLNADEISWVERIKSAITSVGGTITYTLEDNRLDIRCYSKVFNAILSQYVGGQTAKNKHLNICWKLSNDKLKKIVEGYLDGDGHYDIENNRWRLGFTENGYLERDLRTLAARLGAKLTLLRRGARIKSLNKMYPSIRGEWRWVPTNHHSSKKMSEILLITEEKMNIQDKMWDIEVDSDEHLFSLASGVITHNCKTNPMPQVKQPRYSNCFEYMAMPFVSRGWCYAE